VTPRHSSKLVLSVVLLLSSFTLLLIRSVQHTRTPNSSISVLIAVFRYLERSSTNIFSRPRNILVILSQNLLFTTTTFHNTTHHFTTWLHDSDAGKPQQLLSLRLTSLLDLSLQHGRTTTPAVPTSYVTATTRADHGTCRLYILCCFLDHYHNSTGRPQHLLSLHLTLLGPQQP